VISVGGCADLAEQIDAAFKKRQSAPPSCTISVTRMPDWAPRRDVAAHTRRANGVNVVFLFFFFLIGCSDGKLSSSCSGQEENPDRCCASAITIRLWNDGLSGRQS